MIIGAILLVVAILAVGVGVGVRSSNTPASTPPPTPPPTTPNLTPAPTLAPGAPPMIALIQLRSPSTTFPNSVSPQNQALNWILSDTYSSGGLSDDRLVQQFALATLYYSTNGGQWMNHDGEWLKSTNECDWDSHDFYQSCFQESMVQ